MSYTKWNPVQACVWFASRDDGAVSSLPKEYTFAELAFSHELNVIDSDVDFVPVDENTSYGQIFERLDARSAASDRLAKAGEADKAKAALWCTDRPGTAWIEAAKRELLGACYAGALTMTGRSLYGGLSQEIPAAAFATFQFSERDGSECLGPPNLADADCWCDLMLQADQARSVWPPSGAAPDAITTVTPNCKVTSKPRKPTFDEVSAWYAQSVMDHDPKRLPPSRPEDEKAARQYFATQGLNGRGIRHLVRCARARHAPASWKERGAKSHEAHDDNRKARAAVG